MDTEQPQGVHVDANDPPEQLKEASAPPIEEESLPVETAINKEVSGTQQAAEIDTITNTLRNRVIIEAKKKQADGSPLTPSEESLIKLDGLKRLEEGDYTEIEEAAFKDIGIRLTEGNPVYITRSNGERVQLSSIRGRSHTDTGESYFLCTVRSGGVDGDNFSEYGLNVPVAQVVEAQYLSEIATITSGFSESEQRLLKIHAELLNQGDDKLKEHDATALNALITEIATDNGVLSSEDIQGLLKKIAEDPQGAESVKKIQEIISQRNLLDYESVIQILDKLGFSASDAAAELVTIDQRIQVITSQPLTEQAQQEIHSLNERRETLASIHEAVGEQGGIAEYFKKSENGYLDLATAKTIATALRDGDLSTALSQVNAAAVDKLREENNTQEINPYALGLTWSEFLILTFKAMAKGTQVMVKAVK